MFVTCRSRATGLTLGLLLALAGCGPGGATTRSGAQDAGPAAPTRGFDFPSLAVEWTPPMLTAGDATALAAVLGRHPQVRLVLGPRLAGAGREREVADTVRGLSPSTEVVGVEQAALATVVAPPEELRALRREGGARPRYEAALTVAGQGGAVVAIDDAAVDLRRWQALPSSSVGSCEPAMRALADGQEAALTELAPFLDLADGRLERGYRGGLKAAAPGLVRAGCEGEAQAVVAAVVKCLADVRTPCPGTPKFVLVGGARIVAPVVPAAGRCGGRDVARELRGLADAAAESAVLEMDRGWTLLADRLGTLTEVHAALEDVCVPRRRRFAAADVAEARARLGRVGVSLASDEVRATGGWVFCAEEVAVPGLGVTRGLARFVAGAGSVNTGIVAEARALREFVLSRGLCRAGHAAMPVAAVVGVPGAAAEFFGYFYEEELVCGGLGPLQLEP